MLSWFRAKRQAPSAKRFCASPFALCASPSALSCLLQKPESKLPHVVIANVKWPFPTAHDSACPNTINRLNPSKGASSDSNSLLFLDCPPVLLFPAGRAYVCSCKNCVRALFFLQPADPCSCVSVFACFRTTVRKARLSRFCPTRRHFTPASARVIYRNCRSTTTTPGRSFCPVRDGQGLAWSRCVLEWF